MKTANIIYVWEEKQNKSSFTSDLHVHLQGNQIHWVVVLAFYGPLTLLRSFPVRSVNLSTLFLDKPYQYLVHILSPVTDNCPSWISGRERMAVEIISWPFFTKECCRAWRSNMQPSAYQADAHPTELPRRDILSKVAHNVMINTLDFPQALQIEPRHDKTNKVSGRPAKTRISWASAQSDQSLRCLHEESLGP